MIMVQVEKSPYKGHKPDGLVT